MAGKDTKEVLTIHINLKAEKMENKPIQRRRKNPRSITDKLDEQVEKIVYRIMTNEGLEETIARAIKKALVELVIRYFLIIGVAVILLLGLQLAILSLILQNK